MKKYYYRLLAGYINLFLKNETKVAELNPRHNLLSGFLEASIQDVIIPKNEGKAEALEQLKQKPYDYLILHGNLQYEDDIQAFLEQIHTICHAQTRLIACYYSALWQPLIKLASKFGLRSRQPEQNWFTHSDLQNFALLTDFEVINTQQKVLLPLWIPIISYLVNRWLAPLPMFSWLCFVNIAILRPVQKTVFARKPSVSVVVPARNEAGNIESIVNRFPKMGDDDELIFIEGNSTDNTWEEIQRIQKKYGDKLNIVIGQQSGKGKGDAVRKGFGMATKEILMILDADMTVQPEDLPKFYRAIAENKGEFINGCRLVYPMEKEAMRFFNILGNKFFAMAFSYVLGQSFKDTLCGTKVLTRDNYERLAQSRSYFGDFDPFGDFDLIFGSVRLGLKIVELPVPYKARTYGTTNIQRWKHGVILLRMVLFASQRLKFI
jgi:Glycosyl transferase family 2